MSLISQLRNLVAPATRDTPPDISAITDQIFIAAHPQDSHVPLIAELGIFLLINMIWHRPSAELTRDPYEMITLRTFDSPRFPIPVSTLFKGVEAALPVLEHGDKILVYCREGRHRSVAMTTCILIARGYTADEAMALVIAQRPIADPHAPHIEKQILAFAEEWQARHPTPGVKGN